MAGKTPKYSFPYPDDADPIYLGASVARSLATAVENKLATLPYVDRTTTTTATANAVVVRDGYGRAQFAGPVQPLDAATKQYVDDVNRKSLAAIPKGDRGPAGEAGPAGPAGPAGKGDPGPAGPAGATGPAGPAGERGPAGPTGPAGAKGDPGTPGAKGDQGPAGATGPAGPAGERGPAGAQGPSGPPGPAGAKGDTGTGLELSGRVPTYADLPAQPRPAGEAYVVAADGLVYISSGHSWPASGDGIQIIGAKGDTGPAGPAGERGPAGADGARGPEGAPGPTGPTGPAGAKGDTGPAGERGPAGPTGPEGAKGDPGTPGATGATGPAGAKGDTGPAGAQGPAGPAGARGPTGPAGAKGDTGAAGATGATGPAGPGLLAQYNVTGFTTANSASQSGTQFGSFNVPSQGSTTAYRLRIYGTFEVGHFNSGPSAKAVVEARIGSTVIARGIGPNVPEWQSCALVPVYHSQTFTGAQIVRFYILSGFGSNTVQVSTFYAGALIDVINAV